MLRILTALTAAVFFLVATQPGSAAKKEKPSEPTLGDQLSGGVKMTPEELAAIEPELAHYYALEGSKPVLQELVETSANLGCKGSCMADMIRLVNERVRQGMGDEAASREVTKALKDVCERCEEKNLRPTGAEISRAVRNHLEASSKGKKTVVHFFHATPPPPQGNK